MASGKTRDARRGKASSLLVFLFVFVGVFLVVIVFQEIAVLIEVFLVVVSGFLFFVFFLFNVVGNGIQRHRMRLRNFQLALALRAAQNLSLFHFVFVHINFCGTFRTTEHVSILRLDFHRQSFKRRKPVGVLYTRRLNPASRLIHRVFSVTQHLG